MNRIAYAVIFIQDAELVGAGIYSEPSPTCYARMRPVVFRQVEAEDYDRASKKMREFLSLDPHATPIWSRFDRTPFTRKEYLEMAEEQVKKFRLGDWLYWRSMVRPGQIRYLKDSKRFFLVTDVDTDWRTDGMNYRVRCLEVERADLSEPESLYYLWKGSHEGHLNTAEWRLLSHRIDFNFDADHFEQETRLVVTLEPTKEEDGDDSEE